MADHDTKDAVDSTFGAGATNKTEGNAKDALGHVKESIGSATGNDSLRADGLKDQAEGNVQHTAGKAEGFVERVKDGAANLVDAAKDLVDGDKNGDGNWRDKPRS